VPWLAGSKRSAADETRGTDFLPKGLVLASRGLQAPKNLSQGKNPGKAGHNAGGRYDYQPPLYKKTFF
jgi:hypothetical protein